jgi:cytochrome bd-type quinol oxidase subunit 2
VRILRVSALILTALSLVPGGAHLFELAGKMRLDGRDYFVVQSIYAGWALFAIPIVLAILANGTLWALRRRTDRAEARWSLAAALMILFSLVLFFIRVYPANAATENWTVQPAHWESLRTAWEFGHAANALLIFAAFVATATATVKR